MKDKLGDLDQTTKDPVIYWVKQVAKDLGTITDVDRVLSLVANLRDQGLLKWVSIKNTGVFAYVITDDFLGSDCLSEIVFYIKPEFRGDIKLVLRYIRTVEEIAKRKGCKSIKIGGNIGYKDQSFIKLLKRLGYVDDTVSKYLGG